MKAKASSNLKCCIVVFGYNRPEHLKRALQSLSGCAGKEKWALRVNVDGPKKLADTDATRQSIAVAKAGYGFTDELIIDRKENLGLAGNVLQSMDDTFQDFGFVVAIEDDLVLGEHFLNYMYEAAHQYKEEPAVMHIGAFNPVTNYGAAGTAIFSRFMSCWGWGTWADRWQILKREPQHFVESFTSPQIRGLNLENTFQVWPQMLANAEGRRKTWAILWYASIYENKGLCLYPARSLVANKGFDGMGTNSRKRSGYEVNPHGPAVRDMPISLNEDSGYRIALKKFYKSIRPSFIQTAVGKAKRCLNLK